jgi:hypothetical protein
VTKTILSSDALRRLAENPLLLTMLLVVKHGAGRLPPDRVSLDSRAVEVLLNTWNIKGHQALETREAVPQLAYVAYEMMRGGKQTATERELIELLEQSREQVPRIGRYAKDTARSFLKRVELRSSLLVEAGHVLERTTMVPFYQFRHLTFQEYLAAVAATDGFYSGYDSSSTALTPLESFLDADEWKEVIPMAAVLAKSQAANILKPLVESSEQLRKEFLRLGSIPSEGDPLSRNLPPPVSRLVRCLIEEAELPQDLLDRVLDVVALFARGCQSSENWAALSRGPYGPELLQHVWELYQPMDWPRESLARNSLAILLALRRSVSFWSSPEALEHLLSCLDSSDEREIVTGLLSACGVFWNLGTQWPHCASEGWQGQSSGIWALARKQ